GTGTPDQPPHPRRMVKQIAPVSTRGPARLNPVLRSGFDEIPPSPRRFILPCRRRRGLGRRPGGAAAIGRAAAPSHAAHAAAPRREVLGQAGQGWLPAGAPGRAYAADSAAVGLRPDDADLLVDRAEAAGAAGWFDKALADLDQVLSADPARLDALIYRAGAY